MWGSLTKISVALLATNSPQKYSPESTAQVARDSRSVYTTLRDKGPVFIEYSPTIRFTYVTPPPPSTPNDDVSHSTTETADWSDYDVMMSDADLCRTMADNDDSDSSTTHMFSKVAKRHGDDKPIALFLPGLDGYGISAASFQFNDLSKTFELWRMSVRGDDRTFFHDLVQQPVQFIKDIVRSTDRPVYVIGESFGGMLAATVALQILQQSGSEKNDRETKNPIEGMILVNPATSFENSSWNVLAPILTSIGKFTDQPEPTRLGPFELPSFYPTIMCLFSTVV